MYEEDKQIQLYEKKLGISKDSKKYEKMAKNLGFDDDLFNFLDGITQKVKPQKNVEGKLKKEKKKKVKKVEKEEDH